MDFVFPVDGRDTTFFEFGLDIRLTGNGQKSGQPIHVMHDLVGPGTGLDVTGPAHHGGYTPAAFPVSVLFTAEGGHGRIGPGVHVRAVIGGVEDNGVIGNAEVIQHLQEFSHVHVMFYHAVGIFILTRDAAQFLLHVGTKVHAGTVPPTEEGFTRLGLALNEVNGGIYGFIIHGLHAFFGQGAGVLDLAVGRGLDHATRPKFFAELRTFRIVLVFRLFLGVEVVEVAEEFIKTVIGGEHFITVTQVILAELTGGIALSLEQTGNGGIFFLHALFGAGQPHFGKTGAEDALAHDKGGTSRGTGLFSIIVGKGHALFGDAVDIGGLVPHHAVGIVTDVGLADIIAPDDQDVGLLCLCGTNRPGNKCQNGQNRSHHKHAFAKIFHFHPPFFVNEK